MFNELSAAQPASSRAEGRRRWEEMIRSAVSVADGDTIDLLATRSWDMFGTTIGPEYAVLDWLKDGDRELRKLFLRISTKVTIGEGIERAVKERFYESEFRLQDRRNVEARGLGLAYLLDVAALSLPSDERWCKTLIDVVHIWLDPAGSAHTSVVEVVNLSRLAHVETTKEALYRRWKVAMHGQLADHGGSAWSLAQFRHLVFGMDVGKQFQKLAGDIQRVVWGKFIELDGAVRDWRNSQGVSPDVPGVRSEGRATMDQFGEERIHSDRHGEPATYKLHVSAGSCRIHFRVEQEDKAIEVGYVGAHLRTKRFRD